MRRLVCAFALVSSVAHAYAPPAARPDVIGDALTAFAGKPLRTHVALDVAPRATPAWQHFRALAPGAWEVSYDAATGVPAQIWGASIPAPGASASPAFAEAFARAILVEHLALLAPGAAADDFELVADHWDGAIRSIGFAQHVGGAAGPRVLGGQVSFRFQHDRLFVIASRALPAVPRGLATPVARARGLADAAFADRARAILGVGAAAAITRERTADVVVPLVADAGVLGYRRARELVVDGGARGTFATYLDAATGEPIAARQRAMFATGTVSYRGVDRYPGRPRVDVPAPRARLTVAGAAQTSSATGAVTWSPDSPTTVTVGVAGDLVTVVDKTSADATPVSADLALAPGGTATWDLSSDAPADAQLVTYLSINKVKAFVRDHVDAGLAGLDDQLVANTNIASDCNAFFDGKAVNFFHASAQCENSGRIEDVVFHEFGHYVHTHEIIDGVGSFDGAMSEGAADFLAASITGDSGMGRGFFYNDDALRELDPPDKEWIYPRDIGEVHFMGQIYGGTFWDLRKAMIAKYGADVGVAKTLAIYVGTLRRATDIPSTLIEALATDDDDGDLGNGTPDECEIRAVWGHHGMRTATGRVLGPDVMSGHALATQVTIDVTGLSARCTGDELAGATLSWRPSYTGQPVAGSAPATAIDDHTFYAPLALALGEAVFYSAKVDYQDGTSLVLPDNLADQAYQTYQGRLVPLYCTHFDTDPFAEGWTTATGDNSPSPWAWAAVPGTGPTDPPAAFTGTHALMQVPGGDYAPKASSSVTLPTIDVGQYSDVRLQYRRWLAVEDSHFDQAEILTNGTRAWVNATQDKGDASSFSHVDKEWRFHDVPLSDHFHGHALSVAFSLTSDPGLELGGWAIDDLCVVANADSVCGDGVKSGTEQCDLGAGNADVPDTCRTYCHLPACGDGIVDQGEGCDDGPSGSYTCTQQCKVIPRDDTGFCATGGSTSPLAFAAPALALALARRRRRASQRASQP